MKYLVAWTYRANGPAEQNEQSFRRGLAAFAQWQQPDSTIYHQFLSRVDGGGGFAVVETDNPEDIAEVTAKFSFIAEYQVYPVLDMADGVQLLYKGVEFLGGIE